MTSEEFKTKLIVVLWALAIMWVLIVACNPSDIERDEHPEGYDRVKVGDCWYVTTNGSRGLCGITHAGDCDNERHVR